MLNMVKGTRLAYVVVPIKEPVKRIKRVLTPRSVQGPDGKKRTIYERVDKTVEEPGGFMVYFPKGHALRFKDRKELAQYGLDRKPNLVNMTGLENPNSPVGRLMQSQDADDRMKAWEELEQNVIALATIKSGKDILTIEEKDAG